MDDIYPLYTEYKSKIHNELINFKNECMLNQIDVPDDLIQKMENCLSEEEYNKLKSKFENYEDTNIDSDINDYRNNPKRKNGISGKWGVFRNYFPMELISKQYDNLGYSLNSLYIPSLDVYQIQALKYALCVDKEQEALVYNDIEKYSNKYWENFTLLTNEEKQSIQQQIDIKQLELLGYKIKYLWTLHKKNDVKNISNKINYIKSIYDNNINILTENYNILPFTDVKLKTFTDISKKYETISLLECSPKFYDLFEDYFSYFEQQYKNIKSNGWDCMPYLIQIFTEDHYQERKLISSKEFCKRYWSQISYQEIMGCLSLVALDHMLYSMKSNNIMETIQNFQSATKFIKQIGDIEISDFYLEQINSIKNEIPSLGGKKTAEYWLKEKNKLKNIWLQLPQETKKSNKKSITFLSPRYTSLSYRTLEMYIREWRKDST